MSDERKISVRGLYREDARGLIEYLIYEGFSVEANRTREGWNIDAIKPAPGENRRAGQEVRTDG